MIILSPIIYPQVKTLGKKVFTQYKTIDKVVDKVEGIKIKNAVIKYKKNRYEYNSAIFINSNTTFRNYDAIVSMRFLNLEKERREKNGNYVFN